LVPFPDSGNGAARAAEGSRNAAEILLQKIVEGMRQARKTRRKPRLSTADTTHRRNLAADSVQMQQTDKHGSTDDCTLIKTGFRG
jgi:hypothetical protein